jgi:hypothetical protein
MNLFYLYPIFLIKRILVKKTFLQLAFPLVGICSFVKSRKISNYLLPFYFFCIYGMLQGALLGSFSSIARCGQVMAMGLFTEFIFRYLKKEQIEDFIRASLFWGISYNLFFWVLTPNKIYKSYGFVKLPMIDGIIGEPNFSGLYFLGCMLYFFLNKNLKWASVSFLLILMTASRSMIFTAALGGFIFGLQQLPAFKKIATWGARLLGFSLILYPFLFMGLYKFAPKNKHELLNKLTSGRFGIHSVYADMALKKPFGVGYFKGKNYFNENRYGDDLKFPTNHLKINEKYTYEQHSVFIQVLSEFGFLGYLFFAFFVISFFIHLYRADEVLANYFIVLLFPLTQLNGLHEFILYFFLALGLKQIIEFKKDSPALIFNLPGQGKLIQKSSENL